MTPAGIEHVMLFQCDSLLVCPIFSLGYSVTTRARAQDLPEKSVTCGLCWWVCAAEGRIVAEKDWPGVLSSSPLQFGLTLSLFCCHGVHMALAHDTGTSVRIDVASFITVQVFLCCS